MPKMHKPVIKVKYKGTRETRVIPITEHKVDKIHWAGSISISTDAGETEILKEAMTRPNVYSWKTSSFYDVDNFLSRKS